MPDDRVAVEMLQMLTPQDAANPETPAPSPLDAPAEAAVTPVDPKTLVGTWSSARDDGSQFKLDLTADSNFTWTFTPKGQAPQSFGGTYGSFP